MTCRQNEAGLFGRGNAGGCAPVMRILAQAHFDKDKDRTFAADYVDLSTAHPEIAFEDVQTVLLKIGSRQVFGSLAAR